jgi:hypothetical protein
MDLPADVAERNDEECAASMYPTSPSAPTESINQHEEDDRDEGEWLPITEESVLTGSAAPVGVLARRAGWRTSHGYCAPSSPLDMRRTRLSSALPGRGAAQKWRPSSTQRG